MTTVPSIAAKILNTRTNRLLQSSDRSDYVYFRMIPRVDDIIKIVNRSYRVTNVVHVFDYAECNSPEIIVEVAEENFSMRAAPRTCR